MKKILAIGAIIWFALAMSAFAEEEIPQACTGKNLLNELTVSDPSALADIEMAMKATRNHGALFWKIQPPNKSSPSYLLGTAHVTDTRVATLNEDVKLKLSKSKVLLVELKEVLDKKALSKKFAGDAAATNLPEGQSVWDLIPDDKEPALNRSMMLAMIPRDKLARYRPWVIAQMAALPLCEAFRQPFKPVLDEALAKFAQSSKIEVKGLETVDEQAALFSKIALTDQVQMLVDQLDMNLQPEDTFQTLVELYLARKVTAFAPLMQYYAKKKSLKTTKSTQDFERRLLDDRNRIMVKRAKPFLKKGNAFMAVGALHLYGDKGVIALLQKAGYKFTPAE